MDWDLVLLVFGPVALAVIVPMLIVNITMGSADDIAEKGAADRRMIADAYIAAAKEDK